MAFTKLRLSVLTAVLLITIYTLSIRLSHAHSPIPSSTPSPPPTTTIHSTFSKPPSNLTYPTTPARDPKNAYIFYATTNTYACSALVNIHRLRRLSASSSAPSIIALLTRDVSSSFITRFRAAGVTTIVDHDPPKPNSLLVGSGDYYRDSLLKLRSLGVRELGKQLSRASQHRARNRSGVSTTDAAWMAGLERVVVLDADQLVLQPLSELFDIDLGESGLAAPAAYWITSASDDGEARKPVTSSLLVADLTHPTLWPTISNALANPRRGEYDMDIINRLVTAPQILPASYCVLNSLFRHVQLAGALELVDEDGNGVGGGGVERLWMRHTKVLHFTDGGKPWDFVVTEKGSTSSSSSSSPASSSASSPVAEKSENRERPAEQEPWSTSLRRWALGPTEEELGEEIWEEAYRVWQAEARDEEVCGWRQHVVELE